MLLPFKVPRAIPAFAGGSRDQPVYALDECHGWSVVRHYQKRRFKGVTSLPPALRPIGGKPFGEVGAQFELRSRQLALTAHDLEYRLRLGLTERHYPIDFARLDHHGGTRDGGLGHEDAAAILLVGALQT